MPWCRGDPSRRRTDGLYPCLRMDKQDEGIPVASEGESSVPASVRFGNAKLISKKNRPGGNDYVFEVEEL